MGGFAGWWAMGGIWMYAVLLADVAIALLLCVFFVVALISAVTRRFGGLARALGIIGLLATLTPLCAGFVGRSAGRSMVEEAIVNVDPTMRDELRAQGEIEAAAPFQFGLGSVCVLFGGALVVLVTGFVAGARAPNPYDEEAA